MVNTERSIRWKIAQRAEIAWWKSYLRSKPVGDYLNWKKDYWRNFLREMEISIDELSGKKVLEIGCGPAGVFTILSDSELTAIDPLLNHYEKKVMHFDRSMYPKVKFVDSSLEDFVNSEYDFVFCINVINHVQDLNKCLERITKLVTAGGVLVLSIDVHNHELLKRIFRFTQLDILHPHQFDLEEYKQMLKPAFRIDKVKCLKERFIFDYYALKCVQVNS